MNRWLFLGGTAVAGLLLYLVQKDNRPFGDSLPAQRGPGKGGPVALLVEKALDIDKPREAGGGHPDDETLSRAGRPHQVEVFS